MVQLVRISDALPEGFEALRAEAVAQGHRNMDRLAQEWAQTPEMFVALLGAIAGGELQGIGGLTVEPEPPPEAAMRMRRLYVAKAARGQGVARSIVNALLQEALGQVRLVTVHSHGDATGFWEAMGFTPIADRPWSHVFVAG